MVAISFTNYIILWPIQFNILIQPAPGKLCGRLNLFSLVCLRSLLRCWQQCGPVRLHARIMEQASGLAVNMVWRAVCPGISIPANRWFSVVRGNTGHILYLPVLWPFNKKINH